jgi:hypothetical protein
MPVDFKLLKYSVPRRPQITMERLHHDHSTSLSPFFHHSRQDKKADTLPAKRRIDLYPIQEQNIPCEPQVLKKTRNPLIKIVPPRSIPLLS